jgi:transcriptional regulator
MRVHVEPATGMYIPDHFHEKNLARLDWLASQDAFATLVSVVDGVPVATHLPVLYQREGEHVTLTGHWARPNPQWRTIEAQRALCILHGPHAYISPRWYTDPAANVPTWNYAVAHLYGRVKVFEEPAALAKIVSALAAYYEAGADEPWRVPAGASDQRLRGIVGFEFQVTDIELKFKLNQNHSAANIEGAASALALRGTDDARAVGRLMQQALHERRRP